MNRRQASLYLHDQFQIESLRFRHNPNQARLIPPHVTLCREDEVSDWDRFRLKLESLCPFEITLEFGAPIRERDFVYLPVCKGLDDFHRLRCTILMKEARKQIPHITLIHPRNGTCTDQIFADILTNLSPFQYTFREVVLIEQNNGGVWNVVSRVGKPGSRLTSSQPPHDPIS